MNSEESDKLYEWCMYNDEIPLVRAYLGALDVMVLSDSKLNEVPKKIDVAAAKVYDWLLEEVRKLRGE